MESFQKNDSEVQSTNQNGKEDQHQKDIYNTADIQTKMEKVDVKMPSSLSLKNILMLPSEIIKIKQNKQVKANVEMPSSGSATGKIIIFGI